MQNSQESSLSFRDALRAIVRQRRKALDVFGLTMALVVAALLVWPRNYVSEGKLYVRPTVKHVAEDPSANRGQTVPLADTPEFEVNTVVDMLQSRALAERVVDKLGPAAILGEANAEPLREVAADDPAVRESAVLTVTNSLEVFSPKESAVVNVKYTASSPKVAQQTVEALLAVYLEEHVRVNRSEGSHDFFQQQTDLLLTQLHQANENLRAAKSEIGVASIEGQRRNLEQQLNAIQLQMIENDRQLSESRAKIAALSEAIDSLPATILREETTGHPNQAADDMRSELYKVQAREQELLAKYTDAHPYVIAVRQQVRELQNILADQPKQRTQNTTAVNPARQQLEINLLSERAILESLVARSGQIDQQQQLALDNLKRLNGQEVRIRDLERQAEITETTYRTYASKLEQARMFTALENDRISNVKIAQNATFVQKPVSPRKRVIMMVGFILAVFGGIGTALVAETFDSSLNTHHEIEQQLDLPVLLSIPRMPSRIISLN